MKPTFQASPQARRSASQRPGGLAINNTPAIDWNFQHGLPNLRGNGSACYPDAATNPAAGFRRLSQSFLEAESKRSYAEAGAFILIIGLAVWPIAQAVQAAITLIK
ncbi:hypothetical protein BH18VER1_BH18VER1_15990 [soil metagenome]